MSAEQSTNQPQPTPQEVVASLERAYVERARVSNDLKDQLVKLQDQLLAAQDAAFKTYQNLANYKEQHMASIILNQRAQQEQAIAQLQAQNAQLQQARNSRQDNLAPIAETPEPEVASS